MTHASAPGKIILFGEHAVVYGRPALAVPVTQVHADAEITDRDSAGVWIDAPDIDLHSDLNALPSDHPIAAVIHNLFFLARTFPSPGGRGIKGQGKFPNLNIHITSTIPVASGLGSGAAVTVALTRALSQHINYRMDNEQTNAFAYEIEKIHHGTPSGIDNTVVTYANPVYFVKGQTIEIFHAAQPFTIVIGNTGISAPTKESVGDVRKLWESDKAKWEKVFDEVGEIAKQARQILESDSLLSNQLGELMNQNHALLQKMTVSSLELDRLVSTAMSAGALGAKMSGGGRGGNMIALVKPEQAEAVAQALTEAGAKSTIITQIT